MKRVLTFVITIFLGATLALAQNTGGDKTALNPQPLPPGKSAPKTESKTTEKSGKKGHKGGKKSKKGNSTTTTPPPK